MTVTTRPLLRLISRNAANAGPTHASPPIHRPFLIFGKGYTGAGRIGRDAGGSSSCRVIGSSNCMYRGREKNGRDAGGISKVIDCGNCIYRGSARMLSTTTTTSDDSAIGKGGGESNKTSKSTDGGENDLRIWEFRVANGDTGITQESYDDSDADESSRKKRKRRREATLYTPNDTNGWTSITTKLGDHSKLPSESVAPTVTTTGAEISAFPALENIALQLEKHILRHFLPAGYPDSVAPGYRNYVAFCFSASVCGSAAMVLSTQTLLMAVGVGSSSAAPLAAALNWVMKDGIGQLGGIIFASRLGSATAGSSIDSDPKRWRMASAISMDGATWLEILSPLFPGYFLPIASVANIGKNIGFLTASASRAAIHQSLTRRANLGDVTAKAGSQSIAASLFGTGLGISLSPLMHSDFINVAAGFAVLSVFHQVCTYQSLRHVHLRSLNRHRLNLVLEQFVRECVAVDGIGTNSTENFGYGVATPELSKVLSPSDVAELERFIPFLSRDETKEWLKVGCKLEELFPGGADEYHSVRKGCIGGSEKYLLNCKIGMQSESKVPMIYVAYLENADGRDVIRGMLHAHIIHAYSNDELALPLHREDDDNAITALNVVKTAHGLTAKHFDALIGGLNQTGWNTHAEFVKVESGAGYRMKVEQTKAK